MKRLGLLVILAAVAAAGVVYTVKRAQSTAHANVTALIPRGTIALAHVAGTFGSLCHWAG